MKMYKRGATVIAAVSVFTMITSGCAITKETEVRDTWTEPANRSAAAASRAEDAAKRAEAAAARMEAAVQKIENVAGKYDSKMRKSLNK
ncbi:MAG: hypothetical protein FJ147_27890 [Deltaproteobacteria bacterium]|nr:hypothetical protein [Deltaproteobacteria bacterium]